MQMLHYFKYKMELQRKLICESWQFWSMPSDKVGNVQDQMGVRWLTLLGKWETIVEAASIKLSYW